MFNEINLLPPVEQHQRAVRVYAAHIGGLLRVAIVMGIVIVCAQWALVGWYWFTMTQLQIEDLEVEAGIKDTQRQITQNNRTIGMVNDWFNEYEPWTPGLRGVLGAIPSSIELVTMGVQESRQVMVITGPVSNRVDVVNFQRQLEELPWIAQVEAPLSNFETGTEAKFSFTIKR